MFDVKDRYFSLNRTLLVAIGLWPYEISKFTRFQLGFFYIILITSVLFQLTPFLTSKYTIDVLIINLSITPSFLTFIIKYNSFYVNRKTIKYLIEELQYICDNLKNNEIAIIDKYGNIGKQYTVILTTIVVSSLSVLTISQLCSDLTSSSSVNISRQHHQSQLVIIEYYINQERYEHLLLFHTLAAFFIGLVTILATGAMLIVFLQYACGLFKIARYANTLISNFEISFFFLIICGVLILSLNVFRIFQVLSSTWKIDRLLLFYFINAGITIIYMFLANFMGQQIINHNNNVYAAAYESPWYLTHHSVQRLIVLLLQRGNKIFGLNVGGLFIASLECFATLINASVSYFTVMYSTRS